jgi:hypothetical protein
VVEGEEGEGGGDGASEGKCEPRGEKWRGCPGEERRARADRFREVAFFISEKLLVLSI